MKYYYKSCNLEEMMTSSYWFIEGTFEMASCTIRPGSHRTCFKIGSGAIIGVFASLLPDKTVSTNERFVHYLLLEKPELNPITVMTDFARAARQQAVSRDFF
jgi:hypothetical protein